MSDDPKLPVTAAVTTAPIPEGFSLPAVYSLARDLALNMYDEAVILKKNDITPAQYETLKQVPYFQAAVEQMAKHWNSPAAAQQRLAHQTAVGLEEVLPDVIARAKVKNEPLQGVAQLVKVLADIAGVSGNAKQSAAPVEKFKITINLGADTEVYDKTRPGPVINLESASDDNSVETIRTGLSSLLSIQTEPEKA